MGFLSAISKQNKLKDGWSELMSVNDFEVAMKQSYEKPVVLFKHSTTCGISTFAKSRLDKLEINDLFSFYYLDLLAHRDISDAIASKLHVIHQSPQIIIVNKARAIFNTSHHAIDIEEINKIIENLE